MAEQTPDTVNAQAAAEAAAAQAALTFNPEEMKALTDDLQVVLEKHGADMGVTSTINLMKSTPAAELKGPTGSTPTTNDSEKEDKKADNEAA